MPKTPPTSGRFKPGNNMNPLGASAHNKDLKQVRRLTKEQVAEIGSLILEGNLEKLQAIKEQKSASVLKVWFASVAVKAISKGDAHALTVILDRIVGKVKDELHHTIEPKKESSHVEQYSTEDLIQLEAIHERNKPSGG